MYAFHFVSLFSSMILYKYQWHDRNAQLKCIHLSVTIWMKNINIVSDILWTLYLRTSYWILDQYGRISEQNRRVQIDTTNRQRAQNRNRARDRRDSFGTRGSARGTGNKLLDRISVILQRLKISLIWLFYLVSLFSNLWCSCPILPHFFFFFCPVLLIHHYVYQKHQILD